MVGVSTAWGTVSKGYSIRRVRATALRPLLKLPSLHGPSSSLDPTRESYSPAYLSRVLSKWEDQPSTVSPP